MIDNSIFDKMTLHAKNSFREAENLSVFYGEKTVKSEHLLYAIFLEKGSLGSNILYDSGIRKSFFDKVLKTPQIKTKKSPGEMSLSKNLKNAIVKAYSLANKFKYPYVGTEHLAFSIMEKPTKVVSEILQLSYTNRKTPKKSSANPINSPYNINSSESNTKINTLDKSFLSGLLKALNLPNMEFPLLNQQSKKDGQTPALDYFCVDLNKKVLKNNHLIIGRDSELERIATTLGRKDKNNPLLIGDPGVGKTALIEGLARKINSGNIPQHLLHKKILSLDMALVVAGTSFRGEFEQRLKDIIDEVSKNKDIILFIDEIHSIVGAGNVSGGLDAANILKPALTQGEIQCIGATTLKEYKKYIEKDSALERRFQTVLINEPSKEETEKILRGIKKNYEKFHNVTIAEEAISQAVAMSSRYIQDRFQPDKSIDLIDETSARVRNNNSTSKILKRINYLKDELNKTITKKHNLVNSEKFDDALALRLLEKDFLNEINSLKKKQYKLEKNNPTIITDTDIAETISSLTKIPISKLLSQVSNKITGINRRLNSQIIGQKEAIKSISETILRSQAGVSGNNRPIGSFMFLGPSGVGKTLTAKTLAKEFFGNPEALIKIDMSEFMERHSVSRLLGAPAGYIGYGEGGKLTEQIRRQPYSLVLFDEIEKAHPDIFNILLQILEDGSLTDAEGRKVNFKNTIIILTSNIGTNEFTKASEIGFNFGKTISRKKTLQTKFTHIKEKVLQNLKDKLKPEILNRLDYILVFNTLSQPELKRITNLELKQLKKRLQNRSIVLNYSKQLVTYLAGKSSSDYKGARYIQKNIRDLIENKIAEEIIKSNSNENKIFIDIKNENIKITTSTKK
ncbi:MAG TPA: ATP-dependent Clp protease ATP-binding subunit [Candidatus Moranbacteria bacterium]|nr:ATP-dependent Clp protease ATP-binding subunit [Candidatus Moranbacteria bacterium]